MYLQADLCSGGIETMYNYYKNYGDLVPVLSHV